MTTEMLKQLSLSVFGLGLGVAVLAASADTAMADRGKARWVDPGPRYTYDAKVTQPKATTTRTPSVSRKFQNNLDFETEAVWRNLRPSRFVD